MSKAGILEQIAKLTPVERDEIRQRLDELEEDALTPEESALIDKRIAEHDSNPESAIKWNEFKAQLDQKFGGRAIGSK
jgi:putative addiction module component (TIGR02574 family)